MKRHLGEDIMNFTQVIYLNKLFCVALFFYYLNIYALNQLDVELYKSSCYPTFQELWKFKNQWSPSIW